MNNFYQYSKNPLYKDRALDNPSWSKILFGSKPLQASELIEIQTIQQQNLHRSLSTFISNGSILKGLNPILRDLGETLEVELTPGLFYLDGFAIEVAGKTFSIAKEGIHHIYLKLREHIITEAEDSSLRDTNTGGELYGMPGAARLLWTAEIITEEKTDYLILTIKDGVPQIRPEVDRDPAIHDRYGDFIVEGLSVTGEVIPNLTQEEVDISNEEEDLVLLKSQERKESSILRSLQMEADYLSALDNLAFDNEKRFLDLPSLIEEQQIKVEAMRSSILDTQASLYERSLTQASLTKQFKKKVYIQPGLAYVMGSRVEKNNVTSLELEHNLDQIKVQARPFTFSRARPFNNRVLRFGTPQTNLKDLLRIGFTLYFSFSNLSFGEGKTTVRVSLTYDETLNTTSLESIAEDIVNHLSSKETIEDRVRYSGTYVENLSPYLLRSILQQNLEFHSIGTNTITFESLTSNDIKVDTSSSNDIVVFDKETTHINHLSSNEERTYFLHKEVSEVEVRATKKKVEYPITRSSTKYWDALPDDSVLSLIEVKQGDKVYIEGRDYYLNMNRINWDTNHEDREEPDLGTTYYVTLLYTKQIEEVSIKNGYLRFSGDFPLDGSTFYVDYSYYSPSLERLYLDNRGSISLSPLPNSLAIAQVEMGATYIKVDNIAPRRWTSKEIYQLKEELIKNRDSIRMIVDKLKEMEDPSLSMLGEADLNEDLSSYGFNRSDATYRSQLKRKDVPLGEGTISLPYSTTRLRSGKIRDLYLTVKGRNSNRGFLLTHPQTITSNGEQWSSLQKVEKDVASTWVVESDVRDYLSDNHHRIKYEVEHNLPQPNKRINVNYTIKLKAIGLPPSMAGFLVYIDGTMVNSSSYVREEGTIYNGISFTTAKDGTLEVSVKALFTVGIHTVEIKNSSHTCSSYFSVMDVGKITQLVTASHLWNQPISINAKRRSLYPANPGEESLPYFMQEFKVDRDTFLHSIGIDVIGSTSLVVGRKDNPSLLGQAVFHRELNGTSYFNMESPIHLKQGEVYYIGFLNHEDIKVGLRSRGYIDTPVKLSDGYRGYYLQDRELIYSLNSYLYQEEDLVEIGSYSLNSGSIEAFSINSIPYLPASTKIEFFYEMDSSLRKVEPFSMEHLALPQPSIKLLARLGGNLHLTPQLDLASSSISLYGSESRDMILTSKSIPYENQFSKVVVHVEHIEATPSSVMVGPDGVSWFNATELESSGYPITTTKYQVNLSNSTNKLFYKVTAPNPSGIRSIRLLV